MLPERTGVLTLCFAVLFSTICLTEINNSVATDLSNNSGESEAILIDAILESINLPNYDLLSGKIIDVTSDGLFVVVFDGNSETKVRLYGADYPITGQDNFQDVQQFIKENLLHVPVAIVILTIDSEQIPVGLIFGEDGESIGHLLVSSGMAWWDIINTPKDKLLRALHADAITGTQGLFSSNTPVAPWDYRISAGITQFKYSVRGGDLSQQEISDNSNVSTHEDEPRSFKARGSMSQRIAQQTPRNVYQGSTAESLSEDWYKKGTLHKSTAAEWKYASYENRLATAGDFVVRLMQLDGMQIPSLNGILPWAYGMELAISTAVREGVPDYMSVAEIAAGCWILMEK